MTVEDLINKFNEIGIPKGYFSLKERTEEKFYLIKNEVFFEFYFLKQGTKRMYKFFESEEDACSFFYNLIIEKEYGNKIWKHIKTIQDNEKFKINGINIWDFEWVSTKKHIIIEDPLYSQPFLFEVYELKTGRNKIVFAAGEFSNGIWGIYQEE